MAKIVKISRDEAIRVLEMNLKFLKQCSGNDTFVVLSYDLEDNKFIGKQRMNHTKGEKLINKSETFILNDDSEDEFPVSVLSMYSEKQLDIFNIIPKGKKHDMLLIPKLE